MSLFTPLNGLLGGSLIGLSASVLLLGAGEIMGASGIASSCLLHPIRTISTPSHHWRIVFLASFLVISKMIASIENTNLTSLDPPVVSALGHVLAGLLVGLGTKIGNGCTSGHGICGLARFSKRSLVNVISFMSTAILTATICGNSSIPITRYLRDTPDYFSHLLPTKTSENVAVIVLISIVSMAMNVLVLRAETKIIKDDSNVHQKRKDEQINYRRKFIPAALSGGLFAIGLTISSMCKASKVLGFLDLTGMHRGTWDPTLLFVMGSGMGVSMLGYQFVKGYGCFFGKYELSCPLALKSSSGHFEIPRNKKVDLKLILGGVLFGLGWGIGGICPGPAFLLDASGFRLVLYCWTPAFILGSVLGEKVKGES